MARSCRRNSSMIVATVSSSISPRTRTSTKILMLIIFMMYDYIKAETKYCILLTHVRKTYVATTTQHP